jgi:ABC-type methionine transport system ATPase subunit
MAMKIKIYCTFPQEIIREPLLYNLSRNFNVIPNIRGASVTDESGFMALELEGTESELEGAVSYLKEKGVKVETVDGESAQEG